MSSQYERESRFRDDLEKLINCHSVENGSDTPDFILAKYLMNCLFSFDVAVNAREKWYGRGPKPATTQIAPPPGEDIRKWCEHCKNAFGDSYVAHPDRRSEWLCRGCIVLVTILDME